MQCSWTCAVARRELQKVGQGYRQYWYDREHGVKPMKELEYRLRYGKD
jgi:hypothetical protein